MTNKPQIKTINDAELREVAIELNDLIFQDFLPDIIIGIKNGGYKVAEIMVSEAEHKPLFFGVSMQRTSTKNKSKIKNILRHLPYIITDNLRILENNLLFPRNKKPQATTEIPELQGYKNAKILIVDDAVDSGHTLKTVLENVRSSVDFSCVVRTAAITLTTDFSVIKPDYTLYQNVLCRFPWSFDFRG